MDPLFVVTHPQPVRIEVRPIRHDSTPDGAVALGYYHNGHVVARGVVAPDAVQAIRGILAQPVSLAIAATEDEGGNIDGRVCLVLPVDPETLAREAGEEGEEAEPWKASVPAPPELGVSFEQDATEDRPRMALLPIGNVVRGADRRHHDDVAEDAREMLENLLSGRGEDATSRAIDDLLDSL